MNTHSPASDARSAAVAAAIVDWLGGDDCRSFDDAGLVAGLGRRLRAGGLPMDRLVLHLRTLHPEVLGRVVAWAPGRAVQIFDRDFGMEFSTEFAGSPVRHVMDSGLPLTVHPGRGGQPGWTYPDVFRGHGLTELFIAPLNITGGPVCSVSFCSTQPMGFSAAERDIFARILPVLRLVCELRYRAD